MKLLQTTAVACALLVATAPCVVAQTIGRPRHPDPLSRPQPLRSVRTCRPDSVLTGMIAVLHAERYAITRLDETAQTVEAERDSTDVFGAGVDRVILWLERDFEHPSTLIDVYLLYARFDRMFGQQAVVRVRVDDDYVLSRTRGLRDLIATYIAPSTECP